MKKNSLKTTLTAAAVLGCAAMLPMGAGAEEVDHSVDVSVFESGTAEVDGDTMQYRLYDPQENGYEEESYPLVLFLHGEDGVGTDNEKQLTANAGATVFVEMADSNPAYVLAPQIDEEDWTTDENMALVMQAVEDVMNTYKIDEDRIYVEGMSMGGTGTWKMLLDHPDLFAAGMPICGQVPAEYYENEDAWKALANMPVWAFHAADDDVIPEEETAKAVQALKDAGNNCTQYEVWTAGSITPAHEIWNRVYQIGTPYNWLMMQNRERTQDNTLDASMLFSKKVINDHITRVCDFWLGQVYVIQDEGEVLIIDTAMGGFGQADLYAYIRDEVLEDKDAEFDVILTHSHGDHTLGLPSLEKSGKLRNVYIGEGDVDAVLDTMAGFDVDITDKVIVAKEGDVIKVGSKELQVEVVSVPAHTVGSIVMFMDSDKYVFTGDAIGSGDLWLLGVYSVKDCIPGLQHFVDELDARGDDYEILTGHAENKVPFTAQYAHDILDCAKGIVDGSIEYGIYTRREGAYATYGSGNIFFQEDEIFELPETETEAK